MYVNIFKCKKLIEFTVNFDNASVFLLNDDVEFSPVGQFSYNPVIAHGFYNDFASFGYSKMRKKNRFYFTIMLTNPNFLLLVKIYSDSKDHLLVSLFISVMILKTSGVVRTFEQRLLSKWIVLL